MIKLLKGALPDSNGFSPFIYTKIAASFSAYGDKYLFLTFWIQGADPNPTAIIFKQENTVFVSATADADFGEIWDFLNVIGYSSLQADWLTAGALGLKGKSYKVLQLTNPNPCSSLPYCEAPLKRVYDILFKEQNDDICPADFEGFYADLSHRIRHGTAFAEIAENAAVAVASHIHKENAVISGVATLKEKRGLGFAGAAIYGLIKKLPQNIYTASKDEVDFYLRLGFKNSGNIIIID